MVPVVTCFTGDEGLDLDGFAANLRAHLGAGVDGVLVTGSTGEAALVDDAERKRLLAMAREVVPEDRWLIAGVGAEATRQVERRCRAAAEAGCDAALVVAPHYYGPQMTTAALREHYLRVADSSPIPVGLYNIPKYMHFALAAELVAEMAEHPNVIGIKDSSGDPTLLAGYLEAQSPTFGVLTGSGTGLAAALTAGAAGGILAVALLTTGLACGIRDAMRAGDPERATGLQRRMLPAAREIVIELGVPGVKAALDELGLAGGPCRAPLLPLGAAGLERVRAALVASGLLLGASAVSS